MEDFNCGSAALKYAWVSAQTRLRLEDPALRLSISCLPLAIVDLLNVIFDRCCSGIQVLKVSPDSSIYRPVLRGPGLSFIVDFTSVFKNPCLIVKGQDDLIGNNSWVSEETILFLSKLSLY